jgi:hypothetical protein
MAFPLLYFNCCLHGIHLEIVGLAVAPQKKNPDNTFYYQSSFFRFLSWFTYTMEPPIYLLLFHNVLRKVGVRLTPQEPHRYHRT